MHFSGKVSVRALIVNQTEDMVLITKDPNYSSWEIMGGRLEVGESIEDALKREAKEELGIELQVGDLIYNEQFNQDSDGLPHLMLVFKCSFDGQQYEQNRAKNKELISKEVQYAHWVRQIDLHRYSFFANCIRAINHFFARQHENNSTIRKY